MRCCVDSKRFEECIDIDCWCVGYLFPLSFECCGEPLCIACMWRAKMLYRIGEESKQWSEQKGREVAKPSPLKCILLGEEGPVFSVSRLAKGQGNRGTFTSLAANENLWVCWLMTRKHLLPPPPKTTLVHVEAKFRGRAKCKRVQVRRIHRDTYT